MLARLVFPFLVAVVIASCSDGTKCEGSLCDEEPPANGGTGGTGERPPETREGPEGCYILAENRCDCDIAEEECSDEATQQWTEGCRSCE